MPGGESDATQILAQAHECYAVLRHANLTLSHAVCREIAGGNDVLMAALNLHLSALRIYVEKMLLLVDQLGLVAPVFEAVTAELTLFRREMAVLNRGRFAVLPDESVSGS